MNADQLASFHKNGYIIVADLLSDSLIDNLHAASNRITHSARTNVNFWPHVRTVGKQFPPWTPETGNDVWGLGHILHPDLGEPVFMEYYTSPALLATAASLIAADVGQLQMGAFHPPPV